MALIGFTSAKGSPGVTTSALALTLCWHHATGRTALLVEADPAGGDIAAGYLRGSAAAHDGHAAVAAARDLEVAEAVLAQALRLDDTGHALLLTGGAAVIPAQLRTGLADLAARPGLDVLIDLGRIRETPTAQAPQVDVLLVVLRSSLRSVAGTRDRTAAVCASVPRDQVGLLVVGERRPYDAAEIATALGCPVVGSLAWDPTAAEVLSEGAAQSWRFARSALMRSASALAREVHVSVEAGVQQELTGRGTTEGETRRRPSRGQAEVAS